MDTESPYAKEALNEYGDVERYYCRLHKETGWQHEKIEDIWRMPFRKLEQLNAYCEEKGAKIYIFPAAYCEKAYEQNRDKIAEIWNRLEQSGLPIVSVPEEYMAADTLCYDTDYHLTYEGVLWRTEKLIRDMENILEMDQ